MKRKLLLCITAINVVLLFIDFDSVLPVIVLCVFIGLIKGLTSHKISDIYNFQKFFFRIKSPENVLELINSFLICTIIIAIGTQQISIEDGIFIAICSLLLYRFLLYDFCEGVNYVQK